jgi:hypothetical protein
MTRGIEVEAERSGRERISRSDLTGARWSRGSNGIWSEATTWLVHLRSENGPQLHFEAGHVAAAAHG